MNIYLAKSKTTDKTFFLVVDLKLNLTNYQSNAKVIDFVNLIFQQVTIVNKPTRFTKNNATLIDYSRVPNNRRGWNNRGRWTL